MMTKRHNPLKFIWVLSPIEISVDLFQFVQDDIICKRYGNVLNAEMPSLPGGALLQSGLGGNEQCYLGCVNRS